MARSWESNEGNVAENPKPKTQNPKKSKRRRTQRRKKLTAENAKIAKNDGKKMGAKI